MKPVHLVLALQVLLAAPAMAGEIITDVCALRSCRDLTLEERQAFGKTLAGVISAMSPPSATRYEHNGLKSAQGLGSFLISDATFESEEYPSNIVDTLGIGTPGGVFPRTFQLIYTYVLKNQGERISLAALTVPGSGGPMDIYDLKIEITVMAWPCALLPPPEGVEFSETTTETAWDTLVVERASPTDPKVLVGNILLGARAPSESSAGPPGTPGAKMAPVKAIRIVVEGGARDVREVMKKINRKQLKDLIALGKPPPPPPKKKK